jgi:hypothetical protein
MTFQIRRPDYKILSKLNLEESRQQLLYLITDIEYLDDVFTPMYKQESPGLIKDALGTYIHDNSALVRLYLKPLLRDSTLDGKEFYTRYNEIARQTKFGYLIYIADFLCLLFNIKD